MYNNIPWLPSIIDINKFKVNGKINYSKLIEETFNLFIMDFYNETTPVFFERKKVVFSKKILDCSELKIRTCYNEEYYCCEDCKYKDYFDIFNHISTDDYKYLHKMDSSIKVPKYKKRKNNKKIPRTPGKFNIERLIRICWIKAIIENSNDKDNVKILKNYFEDKKSKIKKLIGVNILLKRENYKIGLEPIIDKETDEIKYYVLKTAFYITH